MRFRNRSDAGRRLAAVLARRELHSPVVLGLPRGGVPVALVADEVLCAAEPISFYAVGQFYERFDQTSDDEVLELLTQASARAEATT